MELSKQEMELFYPFPLLGSKNFFRNMMLIWSNDSRTCLKNRKWNYSDKKTSIGSGCFLDPIILKQLILKQLILKQKIELFKLRMELLHQYLLFGSNELDISEAAFLIWGPEMDGIIPFLFVKTPFLVS